MFVLSNYSMDWSLVDFVIASIANLNHLFSSHPEQGHRVAQVTWHHLVGTDALCSLIVVTVYLIIDKPETRVIELLGLEFLGSVGPLKDSNTDST